jgi:2Fe-2S ferredoxin
MMVNKMSESDFHIIVVDQNEMEHTIPALEGWRIMEIIRDNGLPIKAECGGACCCATCHVYVDQDWVERLIAPLEEEVDMLDEAFDVDEGLSRLSCQLLFRPELNGLRVTLAPGTEPEV